MRFLLACIIWGMENKKWLPIAGFAGYEVSDHGQVRSSLPYHGSTEPRLLTPSPTEKGYLRVGLTREGKIYTRMIHRLVLTTFEGQRPAGLQTRHLDGDKNNNRRSNLVYGTGSENTLDTVRHGTHPGARRTHCIRDHEFTPENTYRKSNGGRGCRTCKREHERKNYPARYAARKALKPS